MSLADALLEKGQQNTVLKYFELCKKFSQDESSMDELRQWEAAVEAGDRPDFGNRAKRYFPRSTEQVDDTVSPKQTGAVDAKAESKALKKMSLEDWAQRRLILSGYDLSDIEVIELKAKAALNLDDVESRLQLLGYYSRNSILTKDLREPHETLAIWFIENYPDSTAAGDHAAGVMGYLNPRGYAKVRKVWLRKIDEYDQNVPVLLNAAAFFRTNASASFSNDDRNKAKELLKKAQALDPDNARITSKLAHLHQQSGTTSGILSGIFGNSDNERRKENEQAMTLFEKALKQTKQGPEQRSLIENIAKTSFKLGQKAKAKKFSKRLLDEYGSDGDAVHFGNTWLGLLALEAGEIETAKRHLIESGNTKGSPRLNSFGPSMQLANALLEKEQQATVLEYFELCRKFWTYSKGKEKLAQWKTDVEAGLTPDFGFNLSR